MMTYLKLAIVLLATSGALEALRAETFAVSAVDNRSLIEFQVRQFGILPISGRFERFRGRLSLRDGRSVSARVRIEIDAASINSSYPARDQYLRGDAILASRRYPKITFRSTKTEVTGPATAVVTGRMTFRGITRRVVIRARYLVGRDRAGNASRRQFVGRTSFRLSDFGVTGIPTLTTDRVFLTIRLALRPT